MNHHTGSGVRRIVCASAFASCAAGVLLFLSYRFCYDSSIAHFASHSLLYTVACLLCAVAVLFSVLLWGMMRKRHSLTSVPDVGKPEVFSALFAAALYAAALIRAVFSFQSPGALDVCAAISLIFPAAYFLCLAVSAQKTARIMPWLAFGSAVCAILQLFSRYFQLMLPLNASTRNLETLAAIGMLLFFLSESRLQIGTGYAPASFYAWTNGCAVALSLPIGFAHALHALSGGVFASQYTPAPLWDAALCAVGIFALCRLFRLPGLLGAYSAPYQPGESKKSNTSAEKDADTSKNEDDL